MQPSPELRASLIELYAAMSSGDADSVEAFYSLAPGAVFIGTDAAEFWTDSAQHNADVRPFFDGSNGVLRWTGGEALAFAEGGAGWTIDRPTITLPDGSELQIRVTFVWHLENGAWRVVQSHASVGA